MLLRKITILLILGIIFLFVTQLYITQNSPFNLEKIQELAIRNEIEEDNIEALDLLLDDLIADDLILDYLLPNFYVGLTLFLLAISCFFVAFHLVIDKLFFKEFYENPSLKNAIRRAIEFSVGFLIVMYLKLTGGGLIELAIPPVLIIFIEMLLVSYTRTNDKKSMNDLDKDKSQAPHYASNVKLQTSNANKTSPENPLA